MLLFSRVQLFCDPMDCNPPGSTVHGISQARLLEWVAISFSRGSSQFRDRTHVSCLAGGFFTPDPPGKPWMLLLPILSALGEVIKEFRYFLLFDMVTWLWVKASVTTPLNLKEERNIQFTSDIWEKKMDFYRANKEICIVSIWNLPFFMLRSMTISCLMLANPETTGLVQGATSNSLWLRERRMYGIAIYYFGFKWLKSTCSGLGIMEGGFTDD